MAEASPLRKIPYLAGFLAGLEVEAAPAGKPLLDALNHLRALHAGEPTEIMTDTAGYTDTIFRVFYPLGLQFSSRIADVGGARCWRVDGKADYGVLDCGVVGAVTRSSTWTTEVGRARLLKYP